MRFAGTWKQYSPKAISQLTTIASTSGADLCFKCPYQAKVMNVLEMKRRHTVSIQAHRTSLGGPAKALSGFIEPILRQAVCLRLGFVVDAVVRDLRNRHQILRSLGALEGGDSVVLVVEQLLFLGD